MKTLKAFWLGIREWNLTMTTHYDDMGLRAAYDQGRRFISIATFGRCDVA